MAQNITEIFGKRLRRLRENRNLTQAQLAKKFNISRTTLGYYESAERTPDIVTLDRIAKFFEVPLDFLMGYNDAQNKENSSICDSLGISEKSVENIRSVVQSGSNANILLEYDGFKDIVELLNKIKTITVGQRYYNERVFPNIENNYILDCLFNNSEFQAHIKLLSYIKYATSQIIERQFGDDISISISVIESPTNCNNLYNEKLVLTEYQFTEHIIRTMINDIKNDTTTDNDRFIEFDNQIGDSLDYLRLTLQSNLEDAPNHYTREELGKRKQEIQEDIEILDKFIKFYNEHYRKDSEGNG